MPELNVSRKSIREVLSLDDSSSKKKRFVIPEYQRPYKWDKEKCDTLWIDLLNFNSTNTENEDASYFLGTIVTCSDDSSIEDIFIIDGQQRLTSLFLLLRAFYTKLENMLESSPDDAEVKGLMSSIEPCIWNVAKMSKLVENKKDTHIKSCVATDNDNEVFHNILETGKLQNKKSRYAENYEFFTTKCNDFAQNNPMLWKQLCLCILEKCIVLPIECSSLNSALTIFGTLNDRGLPLSDSDIFKAELYKNCSTGYEQKDFTKRWKALEELIEDENFTLDDLFRYYTHFLRGKEKDKTREIGLRRFYAGSNNNYKYFNNPNFFTDIESLGAFWKEISDKESNDFCTLEAKKLLHCLCHYPNEFWKYPVSVFFFYHREKENTTFKILFAEFLHKLLSFLFVKFIEEPSVNRIKDPVYNFCIEICESGTGNFTYQIPESFKYLFDAQSSSRISRALILLYAYLYDNQQPLVPHDFHIEHIFPKSWQETNYNGWTEKDAEEFLDLFGNKVVLEKKTNIMAGNGYFGKKKEKYSRSKICEVKDSLANYPNNDWVKEDIEKRNSDMRSTIKVFFQTHLN